MNHLQVGSGHSLLGSLVKNSTITRSTSLFTKNLTIPDHERARSYSNHREQSSTIKKVHKFAPICQVVHMLAVKIKKLNYFLFCRLQSNMKQCRLNQKEKYKSTQKNSLSNKYNISHQISKQRQSGINKLIEFIDIKRIKEISQISLYQYFLKIKSYSIKLTSVTNLAKTLDKIIIRAKILSFDYIFSIYHTSMKIDIVIQVLKNISLGCLRDCFLNLQLYVQTQIQSFQDSKEIQQDKILFIQQQQSNIILQSIEQQQSHCESEQNIYPISNKNMRNYQEIQKKSMQTYKKQYKSQQIYSIQNLTKHEFKSLEESSLNSSMKGKKYIIKKSDSQRVKIQQCRKVPIFTKVLKNITKVQLQNPLSNKLFYQQTITKLNRLQPQILLMDMSDLSNNIIFQQKISSFFMPQKFENQKIRDYGQFTQDQSFKFRTYQNGFREHKGSQYTTSTPRQLRQKKIVNEENIIRRDQSNQQIKGNMVSRFGEIQKMMNDLQRIKQKSFMACWTQQSPRRIQHQRSKNKVIVNISSKKYLNSAKKHETIPIKHTKSINYNSDQKKKKKEKENIQVRLFEVKDKITAQSKQSLKMNNCSKKNNIQTTSSMNLGDFTRFMAEIKKCRPQLDTPNDKSRSLINNFKLVFDQKI